MKYAGAVHEWPGGWRAAVIQGTPGKEPIAVTKLHGFYGSEAEATAAAEARIAPAEPSVSYDVSAAGNEARTNRLSRNDRAKLNAATAVFEEPVAEEPPTKSSRRKK